MSRSAMRLAQTGFGLVLLSACGVPESDRLAPGPFLGDWTEVTRIGEYETPAEEVFGSIRAAALIERGGVVILDGQGARAVGLDDRAATRSPSAAGGRVRKSSSIRPHSSGFPMIPSRS